MTRNQEGIWKEFVVIESGKDDMVVCTRNTLSCSQTAMFLSSVFVRLGAWVVPQVGDDLIEAELAKIVPNIKEFGVWGSYVQDFCFTMRFSGQVSIEVKNTKFPRKHLHLVLQQILFWLRHLIFLHAQLLD